MVYPINFYNMENKMKLDKSMNLYRGTIVDEVQYVEMPDGTSMFLSDIGILKGLSPEDNNTALAEALSMRMQIRPSSGVGDMKDSEIVTSIKSRYAQDATEVEGYLNSLDEQLKDGRTDADYEHAYKKSKESVEQPKTE